MLEIEQAFNVSTDQAMKVKKLISGEIDPLTYDRVKAWFDSCYNKPKPDEMIIDAINVELKGYGIEFITNPFNCVDTIAEYVNMGDTYAATILHEIDSDKYLLTTWGDWLEQWEIDNGIEQV